MENNKSGIALVTVICFTALLSILLTVLIKGSGTQLRLARGQVNMEKAMYVAEAGAEHAASYVANGGTVPASFYGTVGDGIYCVTIIAGATASAGSHSVAGQININPNNSPDNEFVLTLPDGSTITRDDLTQNFPGYTGSAVNAHVKPKGNGNQNGLVVDGEQYSLENANTYDVTSGIMSVNLYNDHINSQGKAVGKWWISIATTCATITVSK